MRLVKLGVLCALALVSTGCACRTKIVGPGDEQIATAQPGRELKDVNYAFDSFALDSSAKSVLEANAEWLKANGEKRVQVEGHCDERGTNEYNMALGAKRARAAMEFLRSLGIAESRMGTVSYGEELPLDPAHTESAWAINRRAHFNVQ